MKRSPPTLERYLLWLGTAILLAGFLPVAIYTVRYVVNTTERDIEGRGRNVGGGVATEVVESLLLGDRMAVAETLKRAVAANPDLDYMAVVGNGAGPVIHTFDNGLPRALRALWRGGGAVRFRTATAACVDIPVPIRDGELGMLHVGIARTRALADGRRTAWVLLAALAATLAVLYLGTHRLACHFAAPLRQLAATVGGYPQQPLDPGRLPRRGPAEVLAVSDGVAAMARRIAEVDAEKAVVQHRMVHTERLAALGELAAGLAHEVHNPLDGMIECLRFLQADPDKSRRAEKYYPMLQDGLARIEHVMHDMLELARFGHRVEVRPQPVAEVLDSLRSLVEQQFKGEAVDIEWDIARTCACCCDRQSLLQAGLNLVLNAAEAARPPAGGRAHVRVRAHCDDRVVHVHIEDNGPGVAAAVLGRVFEPFFTTKPAGKGTGLGLSVSRQLVLACGGDLVLAAAPSALGGAHFRIVLPRVQADGRPSAAAANAASAEAPAP